MRWKAWTSSGTIIAVWDSDDFFGMASPIIQVINPASGKVIQTITLPDIPGERWQPWQRMQGIFWLEAFTLSPDETVLAISCADSQKGRLVWLVNLVSGDVTFKQANPGGNVGDRLEIVFSADGCIVAVFSLGEPGYADLALLRVATGEIVYTTSLIAETAYSCPNHSTFVLPFFRIILFQNELCSNESTSFSSIHVPAAAKDSCDAGFLPQHPHVSYGSTSEDDPACATCAGHTLDGGSVSPCGTLFVALGSGARGLVLEHWHLDHHNRSCVPHIICTMPLGPFASGLSFYDDPEESDPLHLLVEWHPCSAGKLLYAVAVRDGPGLIHFVHGRKHALVHSMDLADHGSFTGPISCLKWSPDGRRLAVLAHNLVFIIAAC